MKAELLICALFAAGFGRGTDSNTERAWSRVTPPLAVLWPRDHGAHLDMRTEWWYVTGELETDEGDARFGFQVTVFRQGLDPNPPRAGDAPLRARHALAAHVVLTDLRAGTTRHVERLRRIGAGLAWASENDLDVGIEDVTMLRDPDGTIRLAAGAREAGFALELALEPRKSVVMHGAEGVSRKGGEPGNASAYATIPRLSVRGTLTEGEHQRAVHGEAWFDHEWGSTQLGADVVGWDWIGLRLADERELMLYRLRRADGSASPFSSGTLIERDGTSRALAAGDFEFAPDATTWTSPASGASYPLRWRVAVPSAGIRGELAAMVESSEIDARASTGTIYWEGPARFEGTTSGSAYLELAGYASSLAGKF